MEVGRVEAPLPGTFFSWNRAHFGAWCIVSSPLIMGLELTDEILEPVLDILGNTEAVAVNQAWAGHPGMRLESPDCYEPSCWRAVQLNMTQTWAKPLPGGELAVLLINASPRPLVAGAKTLSFAALNLTTTSVTVRDIWNRSSLGSFHGVWPVPTVPPFDSVFVRLAPE
jgi:alpha-galactosidase